jgi:hypothetical protein
MANMANILNLTNLCYQRRQQMLFNVPLSRNELQTSPYLATATKPAYKKQQLDMRRKAEILKHSSNTTSSQTNLLSRKEKWAQISRANYSGNILFCPDDITIPTLSSACDVPGPITVLFNDPTVPLYNYATKTNSYGINNGTDGLNWTTNYVPNALLSGYTQTTIASLYIKNNQNISLRKFNIKTPFCIYVTGKNISPSGPFEITITINTITTIAYYSGNQVMAVNGIPTYSYSTQQTPINLTLKPIDNVMNFNYSAFVYSGILNLGNINLYTENGYIYDIKTVFGYTLSSPNTTNPTIKNNTNVTMYTNLSTEFYEKMKQNINPVNGAPLAYNCSINRGVSLDDYSVAALSAT